MNPWLRLLSPPQQATTKPLTLTVCETLIQALSFTQTAINPRLQWCFNRRSGNPNTKKAEPETSATLPRPTLHMGYRVLSLLQALPGKVLN